MWTLTPDQDDQGAAEPAPTRPGPVAALDSNCLTYPREEPCGEGPGDPKSKVTQLGETQLASGPALLSPSCLTTVDTDDGTQKGGPGHELAQGPGRGEDPADPTPRLLETMPLT